MNKLMNLSIALLLSGTVLCGCGRVGKGTKINNNTTYHKVTNVTITSLVTKKTTAYIATNTTTSTTTGVTTNVIVDTSFVPTSEGNGRMIEVLPTESCVTNYGLTAEEIQWLRNIVSHEYGSDDISVYEKARIVAAVMNRVTDSRFPNTIYDVLTQPNQFTGFDINGTYYMSDSIVNAVDYYFAHPEEFSNDNSWYGDGVFNYFYYQ